VTEGESESVKDRDDDRDVVLVDDFDGFSWLWEALCVLDVAFEMDAAGSDELDAVIEATSFESDAVVMWDGDNERLSVGDGVSEGESELVREDETLFVADVDSELSFETVGVAELPNDSDTPLFDPVRDWVELTDFVSESSREAVGVFRRVGVGVGARLIVSDGLTEFVVVGESVSEVERACWLMEGVDVPESDNDSMSEALSDLDAASEEMLRVKELLADWLGVPEAVTDSESS
jgi:hypothetical protein